MMSQFAKRLSFPFWSSRKATRPEQEERVNKQGFLLMMLQRFWILVSIVPFLDLSSRERICSLVSSKVIV